jgi:restriction system protein
MKKNAGLLELVSMLPWWLCLGLAPVSYLVLHSVAMQPAPVAATVHQLQALAMSSLWRGLAQAGQYLLPMILLAAAAMSGAGRLRRRRLHGQVATGAAALVNSMSWQDFERLVGEAYRQRGYRVRETGGGGADNGIDLVLERDGERHLVQCKQWRAQRVGVEVVRELYGAMAAQGAAGGWVVTSGAFSEPAREFAKGRNIELIDGGALVDLIRRPNADRIEPVVEPAWLEGRDAARPSCPVCSSPMVRRVARRGSSAGDDFWGCQGFPKCRGTRPVN